MKNVTYTDRQIHKDSKVSNWNFVIESTLDERIQDSAPNFPF